MVLSVLRTSILRRVCRSHPLMAAAAEKTSLPSYVIAAVKSAGAEYADCGGFALLTAPFGSPAWLEYAEWVNSAAANADPSVGCIVAPSPAIAMSTLAPPLALYGLIQVCGLCMIEAQGWQIPPCRCRPFHSRTRPIHSASTTQRFPPRISLAECCPRSEAPLSAPPHNRALRTHACP